MGKWDTPDRDEKLDGELSLERKRKTKKPDQWKVLLHNDDYTTTEFVVDILMRYFQKAHVDLSDVALFALLRLGGCGRFLRAEIVASADLASFPASSWRRNKAITFSRVTFSISLIFATSLESSKPNTSVCKIRVSN